MGIIYFNLQRKISTLEKNNIPDLLLRHGEFVVKTGDVKSDVEALFSQCIDSWTEIKKESFSV